MQACPERDRLLDAYIDATSIGLRSMEALKAKAGTGTAEELQALRRASQDAHLAAEAARIAMERHMLDHNCAI